VARRIQVLELHFPALSPLPDLSDRAALVLDDAAPAAVHESGDEEAPVWRVFFADAASLAAASDRLAADLQPLGIMVRRAEIEDEDWAARSQAGLQRISVGAITVAPPWDVPSDSRGPLVIVQPSTGFGTGHHETTRLCLALLQDTPVTGRRVLDLGTGSGVLALAAWRLGAAEIEAVDVDGDALRNAWENLRLNGAADGIALRHADFAATALPPADVVVANLTGALLQRTAGRLTDLVHRGGTVIVSGILAGELDAVLQALAPRLEVQETREEGEWRAARLRRR
jgi:ribosomal protein L11 methyltransferase